MVADVAGYFKAPAGVNGNLLDANYRLPQACANGQVAKYNTSTIAWECANDSVGTGGGAGTVTNIATGIGLTGGPVTTTGTIGLAATQLMPTTACAANQIPKWNGTAWACAAEASGPTNAWTQGGNAFGAAGVIGTTDVQNLAIQSGGTEVSMKLASGGGLRVFKVGAQSVPNAINGDSSNGLLPSSQDVFGATVGGGVDNLIGNVNDVLQHGTIGGGSGNRVIDNFGTVGGGQSNTANYYGTVGGGYLNNAGFAGGTVSGGYNNSASNARSTVAGGEKNFASGGFSFVAGGYNNTASGGGSFAAGIRAKATQSGQFVWSDSKAFDFNPNSSNGFQDNAFAARATGGFFFVSGINMTTGAPSTWCALFSNSGTWSCQSDRNAKYGFENISPRKVLEKLMSVPVSKWSYNGSTVRNIGPMSQDFHAAFGVGVNDKVISMIDAQGVAFAAIKGLNQKLETEMRTGKLKDAKISALEAKAQKVDALEKANETMLRELTAIKKKLGL